jgi:hypothetical protein
MDVYGVDRESNWPGTQVRGRPLSSSAILHRAVTIDEVHRARAIGRVGSCVAIAIDHSSRTQLLVSIVRTGKEFPLPQRSAFVRREAVVITAQKPSHRITCETYAHYRRVVYCPPSLRLC